MIRKIINLYNLNCESNICCKQNEENKLKQKQERYVLLNCNNPVSCITTDHKFIHIATMDGVIRAFEFTIFDAFHQFKLKTKNEESGKGEIYIPLYMKFLNNKHEQLITADKNGYVSCWYLHTNHPNKRAKCIRNWKTHKGYISGFGIPQNSELIFTIGFDGYLRVRNLGYNGNIIHSIKLSNVALTAMIFVNKTSVLIGTENGIIIQVDVNKEKILNVFKMDESVPIRSLCLDKESNRCYFSFGTFSIGLLDMNDEWNFIGKFVEGFGHHQCAVNYLSLRNEYLWSCSEDNSVRVWDLKFLKESLENVGKKKNKNTAIMPNCIKLADSEMLDSSNNTEKTVKIIDTKINLLEVWCALELKGMYNNGVQKLYFMDNPAIMIALAYQKDVIAYNLEGIDNVLPQKQDLIIERRQQLNDYEKVLENMNKQAAEAEASKAAKGGKGKGKGKKKK